VIANRSSGENTGSSTIGALARLALTLTDAVTWNLSRRKRAEFSQADVIVVSLPKSGTTWLRVFLYSYFCGLEGRPFTLKARELAGASLPNLVFTHDLFNHTAEPRLLARVRGRHIIPAHERRTKPKLMLVRDPRDVIVSLYFELRRKGARPNYTGSLGQMIDDPRFGIRTLVNIMNRWIMDWAPLPNFKLVRYENWRKAPSETFRDVLGFLGFANIDESLLRRSMEFAAFENMQRMEASRMFNSAGLSRADPGDLESYRVRRGIVGGYIDYLGTEQILALERGLALLDQRYGYSSPPSGGASPPERTV
jgi:Sulfotransferase domain